jgi:hypothetical protein
MISVVVKRLQMHYTCKVHVIDAYFIEKNVKKSFRPIQIIGTIVLLTHLKSQDRRKIKQWQKFMRSH